MTDFKALEDLEKRVQFLEHHNRKRILKEYIESSLEEIQHYLKRENSFNEIAVTAESIANRINQYMRKETETDE